MSGEPARRAGRGFTLVEILVVVLILAILAAMVVPRFVSAAEESRENSLRMSVHRIRGQLEIYRQQHASQWPTLANFEAQMTQASNVEGATNTPGTPGFPFGPYIREIPVNPFTGTATVADTAIGTSDWYYDEDSGEFRANDTAEHAEY